MEHAQLPVIQLVVTIMWFVCYNVSDDGDDTGDCCMLYGLPDMTSACRMCCENLITSTACNFFHHCLSACLFVSMA